jgi:hypothetical protein
MNDALTPELQARIDMHLDAVERQLVAAGVPREKRRGITDDLETQIMDMLDPGKGRTPSAADVDNVLSRLDPPEAYTKDSVQPTPRPQTSAPTSDKRTLCPEARMGAWWIALAITAQFVLVFGFFSVMAAPRPTYSQAINSQTGTIVQSYVQTAPTVSGLNITAVIMLVILVIASVVSPIVGTWLGWIAIERIRNSAGKLYGLGIAAIEAIFYPLLLAWVAGFMFWYWIIIAYYDGSEIPNRGRAVWLIGGSCTAILLSVGLTWLLVRFTRPVADKTADA